MDPEKKTVIIVEDERDTAEMLAEMMRVSGYQVMKSYGGSAAIDMILRHRPDAVVLDLMMPDLSGLEVLRVIRQDHTVSRTPVIVVSARSLPEDIKKGMEAGASVYLTKPISFADLRQAVETVIRCQENLLAKD